MRKINSVTYEVGSAKAEQAAGMFGLTADQRSDSCPSRVAKPLAKPLTGGWRSATYARSRSRGNILRKARCAYTTGNLGEALEVIPYTYGDANWKDKLTAYNGQSITYDAIGNPLNDGERTYEWEAGRRLKHISIPLIGSEPAGLHISYGLHAGSQTLLKIVASNDNTVLTAQVARDDREITAMCPASSFNWTRISGDAAADAAWNACHEGMKQVALLPADMASDVQITCTYSETEGSYGTVPLWSHIWWVLQRLFGY